MASTRWSSNLTWGNVWKRMMPKHVWNSLTYFLALCKAGEKKVGKAPVLFSTKSAI